MMRRQTIPAPPKKSIHGAIIYLIGDLIWIIAFAACIGQTNNIKCQGKMWDNSNTTLWLYLGQGGAHVLNLFISIYYYCSQDGDKSIETKPLPSFLTFVKGLCNLGVFAMWLATFILCCIAYSDRDQCNDLQALVLAYIILCSIGLAFVILPIILIPCCMAIILGKAMGEAAKQNNQDEIIKQMELFSKQLETANNANIIANQGNKPKQLEEGTPTEQKNEMTEENKDIFVINNEEINGKDMNEDKNSEKDNAQNEVRLDDGNA